MAHDELKEVSGTILDYMEETIEPLQKRINDLNSIHDFIKFDEALMKQYGSSIGERFGIVNVYTKTIDLITLHLDDVIEGKYDEYPAPAIGSLVFYWDKEVYSAFMEIETVVAELESYMQYFREYDIGDEVEIASQKPTVH